MMSRVMLILNIPIEPHDILSPLSPSSLPFPENEKLGRRPLPSPPLPPGFPDGGPQRRILQYISRVTYASHRIVILDASRPKWREITVPEICMSYIILAFKCNFF